MIRLIFWNRNRKNGTDLYKQTFTIDSMEERDQVREINVQLIFPRIYIKCFTDETAFTHIKSYCGCKKDTYSILINKNNNT